MHGLADKYVAHITPRSGAVDRDFEKLSLGNENGFLWDIVNAKTDEVSEEALPKPSTSEVGIF